MSIKRKSFIATIGAFLLLSQSQAYAERQVVTGVHVQRVAVTGGADTSNPGVSCIKLDVPVVAQCPSGYIAIPNNNADLIRASLVAKSSGSKVWVYFDTDRPSSEGHCPGLVFTPCQVISVMLIE